MILGKGQGRAGKGIKVNKNFQTLLSQGPLRSHQIYLPLEYGQGPKSYLQGIWSFWFFLRKKKDGLSEKASCPQVFRRFSKPSPSASGLLPQAHCRNQVHTNHCLLILSGMNTAKGWKWSEDKFRFQINRLPIIKKDNHLQNKKTSDYHNFRSGGNKNIVNRSLGFGCFFFPFKHTIFGGISANESWEFHLEHFIKQNDLHVTLVAVFQKLIVVFYWFTVRY